jgi:hypothetical protein
MSKRQHHLKPRQTRSASVQPLDGETLGQGWRLEIPAGPAGIYRLAQLDDYASLPRHRLPWRAPLRVSLRARLSANDLPGTWGFGLWNDPFGFSIGLGGMSRRFPTLPNAAWFFYASPPNYLSFRDDLPAQGLLAATFASPNIHSGLLALGSLGLPLALAPFLGRLLRRFTRSFIRQGAVQLALDPMEWHQYSLDWGEAGVVFSLDGERAYSTPVNPGAPLGLVLWIDNQYAAWPPDGRLRYGFLPNPQPAWMEIAAFGLNYA